MGNSVCELSCRFIAYGVMDERNPVPATRAPASAASGQPETNAARRIEALEAALEVLPSPAVLVMGVPSELEAKALGEVEIVLSAGAQVLAGELEGGDGPLIERAARVALGAGGEGLERHAAREGGTLWLKATSRPLGDSVLVDFQDQTELVEGRSAVARDARLLDALLEALPGAAAVSDACDGFRIRRSSRAFADLLGRTPSELAGVNKDGVWGRERALREQVEDERTLESGRSSVRETVAKVNGNLRPVRVTRIPIFDDAGAADQLVSVVEELQPQERAQRVAEARADQYSLLFDFVGATTDRDLGALLDTLEQRLGAAGEHATLSTDDLARTRDAVARFVGQIHGVLRASAALTQMPRPTVRSFDPVALVENILGGMGDQASSLGVELEVVDRLGGLDADLVADAPSVRLALEHLVAEALDGATQGLHISITIDCELERGALLFGIRERQLFESAGRACRQPRATHGLGWGLAMKLADSIGGTLSTGHAPGGGQCCTLEVPLSTEEGSERFNAVEPVARRRVLLIEGSVASQRILRRRFQQFGAEVVVASTEGEAVEAVRAGSSGYDVAVLDLELDGARGARLIEEIREVERDRGLRPVEVVGLSRAVEGSEQAREDTKRALAAGAARCFSKPLRDGDFEALVHPV